MYVVLITSDKSLIKELSSALPAGMEIKDISSFKEGDIAFFDMESGRPGAKGGLSAKGSFIPASRKKTPGPGLEATSSGGNDVRDRSFAHAAVKKELSE